MPGSRLLDTSRSKELNTADGKNMEVFFSARVPLHALQEGMDPGRCAQRNYGSIPRPCLPLIREHAGDVQLRAGGTHQRRLGKVCRLYKRVKDSERA